MRTILLTAAFILMIFALLCPGAGAGGKVRIVTTTTELADFARHIGGDRVEVYSIARGYEDPHFVEAKPSHILNLKRADLFLVSGLQLEIGYSPILEQGTGKPDVMQGGRNYIDCSAGVRPIEIPIRADRSMGDVHPQGNPHYLSDPHNAIIVVNTIARAMKSHFPENASYFETNREAYLNLLGAKIRSWDQKMAPLKGIKVVDYHRNFSSLIKRYGLGLIGSVEPRPGITPTPSHVAALIERMKAEDCRYILVASYFERTVSQNIAKAVNGKAFILPIMPGAMKGINDYISLMDYTIGLLSAGREK